MTALVLYRFQPQALFLDKRVDEAGPGAMEKAATASRISKRPTGPICLFTFPRPPPRREKTPSATTSSAWGA